MRALERRNYVIDRMVENGVRQAARMRKRRGASRSASVPRVLSPNSYAAGFFAEEVRRELAERYGEKKLYEGGLSVRTTLDPKMQVWARKALVDGLVRYDEAHGLPRPDAADRRVAGLGPAAGGRAGARRRFALAARGGARIGRRRRASACSPKREAKSGKSRASARPACMTGDGVRWTAQGQRALGVLGVGDVIYVEPIARAPGQFRLRQVPEISGALVAMDPHTGRVWPWSAASPSTRASSTAPRRRCASPVRPSSRSSTPPRSTTAIRRPRSSWTRRSRSIRATAGLAAGELRRQIRPPARDTLRYGIEHSRNLMTVRLANDMSACRWSPNMPSASASTTRCCPICRWRSARAKPPSCAWSRPIRCWPTAASRSSRR
jgi:penicillin-binding protein 1A